MSASDTEEDIRSSATITFDSHTIRQMGQVNSINLSNATITAMCPRSHRNDGRQCHMQWGPYNVLSYAPSSGGALTSLDSDKPTFGPMFIESTEQRPLGHQWYDHDGQGNPRDKMINGTVRYTPLAIGTGKCSLYPTQSASQDRSLGPVGH